MKQGWEYKKMEDVCTVITDGSHFSPKSNELGKYPMLSVKDMSDDSFDYTNCKYIGEEDYQNLLSNGCKPLVNDVLVAKDGSYLKTAFVQTEDCEQAVLSSIAIIRPKQELLDSKYVALFFKAPKTKRDIESHYLTGSAIKRVILKGFRSLYIPVPPLPTQQSIVSELDSLSKIIADCKETLKDYDALEQSIFYDMFGDPVKNEKGWEVKKVIDVVTMQRGFDLPTSSRISDGGIPVYGSNGILGNHSESKLTEGIITGRSGSIGEVFVSFVPFWPLNTTLFSKDTHGNNIVYLRYLLKNFNLKRFAEGAGVPTLNRNNFHSENIIAPPFSFQQQFADKIASIEQMKSETKKALQEAETLFQARMDYWFN